MFTAIATRKIDLVMQVVYRHLLAVGLTAFVVGSCTVDTHGLTSKFNVQTGGGGSLGSGGVRPDAGPQGGDGGDIGAGGDTTSVGGDTGSGGNTAAGGTGGDVTSTGGTGGDTTGSGGTTVATGGSGGATDTGGASGFAGVTGTGGTTATGGVTGTGGTTATGGVTGAGGNTALYIAGCADGSREGYTDTISYPQIAGCFGAWDEPGLTSLASRTPKCNRAAGNDGARPNGGGCSAADLCAVGWHVCENAAAIAAIPGGCNQAISPFMGDRVFFATRQRAENNVCTTNGQGANNLYGCGTFGGTPDHSCNPLNRLLRDTDCDNNAPWSCATGNGQPGQDLNELDQVVKGSPRLGGVLCCRD
ncbi:MAG TPA: hypothetical protein VHJ20_11565 [Polyangia bacterium]|nr:hypothetical protein [Polyangia bacterium]